MDVSKILDCNSVEEQDFVSQYVGRKLSPEEAEAFEEHYFGCDRCWAEVQGATEVRAAFSEERAAQHQLPARATEPRVIRGPWFSWGLIAAAAAFGAVAIGTVLYLAGRGSPDSERALVQALGNELPVEVRLSGRLSSLKPPTVLRSTGPPQNASGRLRAAAGRAFEAAEEESTPSRLHSAGLAHLFLGEWDLAISSLEEASEATRDAQFLSDLAAAYWIRGRQGGNQADFRSAFQKAEEALARNPRLPEARFNKAMALEKIVPTAPAKIRKAWADYLSLDTKSPWADLARNHLRRSGTIQPKPAAELWDWERESLDKAAAACRTGSLDQIVRRFPQQSRTYVEDDLLPAWADAVDRRSLPESEKVLRTASCISSSLTRVTGNALPSEAILAIESAARSRRVGDRLRDLAAGHRAYRDGQTAYGQRSIDRALAHFQRAENLLRRGGSRFAAAALIAEAGAHFYQNDYRRTLEVLDALRIRERSTSEHPVLAARSLWIRGLTDLLTGHPSEALLSLQNSLLLFQRMGEAENVAAVESLLAETFDSLGQGQKAWAHRDSALRILNDFPDSRILARVTGEAATAAMSNGQARAALFYLDHEIDFARRESNEPLASNALHSRGLVYLALGNESLAAHDLFEARSFAQIIPDPSIRRRAIAELGVTQARLATRVFGGRVAEDLSEALAFFQKIGNHDGIARALMERALLYRREGRINLAKRDLIDAIAELEVTRERLPSEDLRISYFANGQVVFEELISILSGEGQASEAFSVVEQARARELLHSLAPPSGSQPLGMATALRPLTATEIADGLPEGVAILEYVVLEDRLLIWVVRREAITLRTVEVKARDLEEQVSELYRALDAPGGMPWDSQKETRLYNILIEPVIELLERSGTIVVTPDKFLNSVPFAELRDPRDGRHLLEKYKLAVSPSATMFLRGLARDSELADGAPLALLVVGNPTVDGEPVDPLADLPGAEREVRRVAGLFATSHTLLGREATKANFLDLAPSHDVIHFAGHSILNSSQPGYSSLVFSSGPGSEEGLLYAHELRQIRFSRSRLIFLAACETAAGTRAGGEGVLSFARAFLASGLPAAIGTLWPVEDAAATQIASRFYAHLLSGEDAIASLQAAQLELLRSNDPYLRSPKAWAAFELIGATTLHLPKKGRSND